MAMHIIFMSCLWRLFQLLLYRPKILFVQPFHFVHSFPFYSCQNMTIFATDNFSSPLLGSKEKLNHFQSAAFD